MHIVSDLNPSIRLADFVKDIKVASNIGMKESGKFPLFKSWQEGYGSFTYSNDDRENLINYVKNQKEHHKKETFLEEYKRILKEQAVVFEDQYLL